MPTASVAGMDGIVSDDWRGERRRRLLEAAAAVFSRCGYDAASMDEIAQEAGVGKPTLYRYVDSKDALFAAVFVEALDALERRLEAVMAEERDVARRLRRLVATILPIFRDHLVPPRLLGEGSAAADQSRRRIFRERRARLSAVLAEAIRDGQRGGEIRPADPGRVSDLMIGMIWGGAAAIRADDDEVAEEIAALVLHGLLAPGSAWAALSRPGEDGSAFEPATPARRDHRSGRRRQHEAASA